MSGGPLDRVTVWPVADPAQLVHLAPADSWRVRGVTLCGESIKGEAGEGGDPCPRCQALELVWPSTAEEAARRQAMRP